MAQMMARLSKLQAKIILALSRGVVLKSHRYLAGAKTYKLHPLEGSPEPVQKKTIAALQKNGLIQSNQKFPTAKGKEVAAGLPESTCS